MKYSPNRNWMPTVLGAIVVVVIAYFLLYAPDRRDPGQRIGDAINELGSRTPAEKLKDAVQD